MRIAAIPALCLLLTACAPEDIVPVEPMAMEGVELAIEPIPQQPCDPAQSYAVNVRWTVVDWPDPKFDFHIGSSQGILWTRQNRASGEYSSDAFVTPGMWFVMVDRETRRVVAAQPAPPLQCPVG